MVYFSKEMAALLKEYRKECAWQMEQISDGILSDDDFLFRQPGGLPMTPTTFTWQFNKILIKYSLPKELTVHSLRHTNASLLIAEGVDVRTVAGLLGHAQPSTTLDIYSHVFDKTKKEAQEKLGKVLEI
jgi:integrase